MGDNNANSLSDNISTIFSRGAVVGEDIAGALGDTIACQDPPLTVGILGKWSCGKTYLLKRIRAHLEEKTSAPRNNKELSVSLIVTLFRLFFFNPVLNSERNRDVRFLFVDFSILDYSGTDNLWAGVITHISNVVNGAFGKRSVKLFRAWHYRPEIDLAPYLDEDAQIRKTNKRWEVPPFITTFLVPIFVILLISLAMALWLIYGTPTGLAAPEGASSTDICTVTVTAIVGAGIGVKLFDILKMLLNLLQTQAQKVTRMVKNADFSASLGFMGKVRDEIHYITSVVKYMGVLLDKEIRICLIIDDIDLLGKEKIMELFQVISLLHSSPNSLYIQILCMDPMIAANLIKKALSKELSSNVSGHAYLKKHIQLPFFVPPLDYRKHPCPRKKAIPKKNVAKEMPSVRFSSVTSNSSAVSEHDKLLTPKPCKIEMSHLNPSKRKLSEKVENEMRAIQDNLLYYPQLVHFIDGNDRAIKRVSMSAQLAVRLMCTQRSQNDIPSDDIKRLVAWITFVDQWPYRISWIRQVVEDNYQNHRLEIDIVHEIPATAYLEDVYQRVEMELTKPQDWKNLLDLDGDPEMFIEFLHIYPFTVQDMKYFLPHTTNLNNALRRIIAQCSAKDAIVRQSAKYIESSRWRWWRMLPLVSWTIDDVCNELGKMGIGETRLKSYKKVILDKDITGKKLCEIPMKEIQMHFGMTPGDWHLFRRSITTLKTFYGSSSQPNGVYATAVA